MRCPKCSRIMEQDWEVNEEHEELPCWHCKKCDLWISEEDMGGGEML